MLDSINCLRYVCYIRHFEIWLYFFFRWFIVILQIWHYILLVASYSSLFYRLRDAVYQWRQLSVFLICQVSKVKVNFTLFRVFWESEICIIAGLTSGWPRNRVSISGRDNIFFLCYTFPGCNWSPHNPLLNGYWGFFLAVKGSGSDVQHLPLCRTDDKNTWSCSSIPHMNSECGAELGFNVYSALLHAFFPICSWSDLIEYLSLCKSIYLGL
jgi:hypothetical protein